ncbi:putative porin [Steroidobacter sp.]|uniref:putative porin n=1 Tax=Steroidobacter sp. TaxID=1978227 RepID=UPI001A518BCE|nr:putative porin [Steroidobacter sp.]MBL8271410.1 putative porin [Steroidobacter sp.]
MKFEDRGSRSLLAVSILLAALSPSAFAQTANNGADAAALKAQIEALRAEQARIAEQQRQTEAKIRALESSVSATNAPAKAAPAAAPAAPAQLATADAKSKLNVTGDLRLRFQGDYSDDDLPSRRSGQVRGRLGATYAVNDRITLGTRIVTGDADDPNSVDVQMSNWDNDFQVSLDLAYAQINFGDLNVFGGKIPQPFTRTDLVWDGDVNPQGLSGVYKHKLADGSALRASGLFFIIDEAAVAADSTMVGAQLGYDTAEIGNFKFDVSAAYYDYTLGSVATANSGDFRNNLRRTNGYYLSDFNLGDFIVGATWSGLGSRWPVRFVGDYVKNFGAETSQDTGYGADLAIGRASQPGDWRVTYGYSVAETDSVLGAFSHDNIGIGTNYELHGLTFDYMLMPKTQLQGIWYHYKPENALDAGSNAIGDWLDRVRIAVIVSF